MTRVRPFLAAALALAATGCGRVAELEPAKGQPLPVKPMMARTTPSAEQLLTPPTYARANRVDELLKKSEPRRADPFDLPPATGGDAPPAPAGTVAVPVTDNSSATAAETTPK